MDESGIELWLESEAALAAAIQNGQMNLKTPVQREGSQAWIPAIQAMSISSIPAGPVPTAGGAPATFRRPGPPAWPMWVGIALVVAGFCISFAAPAFTGGTGAENLGMATGQPLGVIARDSAIAAVIYFGAAKLLKRTLQVRWLSMVVGAAVFLELLVWSGLALNDTATFARTARGLETTLQEMSAGQVPVLDQSGAPKSELDRWIDSYMQRNLAIQSDLQAAAVRYDVQDMLSPQTFASPGRMAVAKQNAAGLRIEIQRIQGEQNALLDGVPAEMEALKLPANFKRGMIDGFRKTSAQVQANIDAFFAAELQFTDQSKALIQFMEQLNPGGYAVVGQQIRFARPEDLAQYNQMIAALNSTAQQEAQARAALRRQAQEQADRLSNALN